MKILFFDRYFVSSCIQITSSMFTVDL